jgi:hypothetical protein
LAHIEDYAAAVSNDGRFTGVNVRWNFWIIGAKINDYAMQRANTDGLPTWAIWRAKIDH